jgi:hypothetical protein
VYNGPPREREDNIYRSCTDPAIYERPSGGDAIVCQPRIAPGRITTMHTRRIRIGGWFFLFIVGIGCAVFQTGSGQPGLYNAIEKGRFGTFEDAKALSLSVDGTITVVDGGAGAVVMLDQTGNVIRSLNGKGWGQLEFDQPADCDANATLRMYVADYGNARVQVFDHNLNYVLTLDGRSPEDGGYRFRYPRSVAVSRHNDVFILDGDNARIVMFDIAGDLQVTFGGFDAGKGRLLEPSRIRISSNDILGVIDRSAVLFFDMYGNYLARHEARTPVRGCTPFMSGSQWMIATDSAIAVVGPDLDPAGWSTHATIVFQSTDGDESGTHDTGNAVSVPGVRDIVVRENTVYCLTKHEIILYILSSKK